MSDAPSAPTPTLAASRTDTLGWGAGGPPHWAGRRAALTGLCGGAPAAAPGGGWFLECLGDVGGGGFDAGEDAVAVGVVGV